VFSHHFWVSLEIALSFFCLNRTAEKRLHFRDLSVANNDENNKKLKSWIVGKKSEQKKLLSEFCFSSLWKIMVEN
jgi:hypothetical protein